MCGRERDRGREREPGNKEGQRQRDGGKERDRENAGAHSGLEELCGAQGKQLAEEILLE